MALDVHLVTPEREVWSGPADMVIARGVEGEVGILAGHAPMLVRLAVGPLRIHRDDGEIRAVVDGGFLHVTTEGDRTRVDVLATDAELSNEIDVEAARRSKSELEARLAQRRDDADAEAALARANARLALLESR
jgi:F-type H+-transporting ATPase subunit epsilon